MDINTYRMKKEGIIRAIQQAEKNMECFATERVESCKRGQMSMEKRLFFN